MSFSDPEVLVVLAGLAIASYTDLKTGKIPNQLTGGMMAIGLVIHLIYGNPMFSLYGILLAFAIHFTLFALGVEKGGDAKLIMGVGALVGWSEMLEATTWYAILYLPVGLAILTMQGKLKNVIGASKWFALKASGVDIPRPEPTMMKTAPIIAIATVIGLAISTADLLGISL